MLHHNKENMDTKMVKNSTESQNFEWYAAHWVMKAIGKLSIAKPMHLHTMHALLPVGVCGVWI